MELVEVQGVGWWGQQAAAAAAPRGLGVPLGSAGHVGGGGRRDGEERNPCMDLAVFGAVRGLNLPLLQLPLSLWPRQPQEMEPFPPHPPPAALAPGHV